MYDNALYKFGVLYNRLPFFIREVVSYFVALAIPILIFILNYFSGLSIVQSLIGAILFTLSFFAIIIIAVLLFVFLWWIYDGIILFKEKLNLFEGSKLLTPTKIAKTIFSYTNVSKLIKATIEFVIGWCVMFLFWTFLLGICFNYIVETFMRIF